jgi:hypothetical protein
VRCITTEQANYIFQVGKGVSGVLHPDGKFEKCGNGQHHILLEDTHLSVQFQCLYFSSAMISDGSGVISHDETGRFTGVTEEQKAWMLDNFDYFDRGQKLTAYLDWDIKTNN